MTDAARRRARRRGARPRPARRPGDRAARAAGATRACRSFRLPVNPRAGSTRRLGARVRRPARRAGLDRATRDTGLSTRATPRRSPAARRRHAPRRPGVPTSSCAAAPAGSARRRPPQPSDCARPSGPQGRRPHHRPGPPPRPVARPHRARQHPPPGRADIDTTAGGSLDAMMLDMKRTFDEVVVAHSEPEQGRADPREPLLPGRLQLVRRARRSTWRWRSSASCRGERTAAAAAPVGPHRRRHPAVAVGARLPRRPEAARLVPRRPVHPAHLDAPAKAGGRAGLQASSTWASASSRRTLTKVLGGEMLARRADLRRRARHDVRRVPRSAPTRRIALLAEVDGVPRRRHARAGRPA